MLKLFMLILLREKRWHDMISRVGRQYMFFYKDVFYYFGTKAKAQIFAKKIGAIK